MPTGSVTTTSTVFTEFGVQNVWGNAFLNDIKQNSNDTIKGLIVSSVQSGKSIDSILMPIIQNGDIAALNALLAKAPLFAGYTLVELTQFFEINKNIDNQMIRKDFLHILWILKLSQPVYFYQSGYAGNGTQIPAGFESLAKIPCALPTLVPCDVKALSIIDPSR